MDKGPHGTIEKYLARKNIDSMIKVLTVRSLTVAVCAKRTDEQTGESPDTTRGSRRSHRRSRLGVGQMNYGCRINSLPSSFRRVVNGISAPWLSRTSIASQRGSDSSTSVSPAGKSARGWLRRIRTWFSLIARSTRIEARARAKRPKRATLPM